MFLTNKITSKVTAKWNGGLSNLIPSLIYLPVEYKILHLPFNCLLIFVRCAWNENGFWWLLIWKCSQRGSAFSSNMNYLHGCDIAGRNLYNFSWMYLPRCPATVAFLILNLKPPAGFRVFVSWSNSHGPGKIIFFPTPLQLPFVYFRSLVIFPSC